MPTEIKNDALPERPINRLLDQIINPFHHSFKTKWYSIVIKILGREGAIKKENTGMSHCYLFDADIYRIHKIKWKDYLDPLKLINPMKWIELLFVAPLELCSFSFIYLTNTLLRIVIDTKWLPIAFIAWLIAVIIDLGVNIITGIARRCMLAPARYIIRPAIEMAITYPESFFCIFTLTACGAAFAVTDGLPAIISIPLLELSLTTKLTAIALGATWIGSALTKGFNTVCEMASFSGKNPHKHIQEESFNQRSENFAYDLNIMYMSDEPTLEKLNQSTIPLLIVHQSKKYIYGFDAKGNAMLKEVTLKKNFNSLFKNYKEMDSIVTIPSEKISLGIYQKIRSVKAHYPRKTGSTKKITEALHNIDIKHAQVLPIDQQDSYYRAALFFGVESITHPVDNVRSPTEAPRSNPFRIQ